MRYTLTVYNQDRSIDKFNFDTQAAVDEWVNATHESSSDGADLELYDNYTDTYWATNEDMNTDGSIIWYSLYSVCDWKYIL